MVMTGGMAGIAGTVLVLYATMLGSVIPNAAAHFVIASVMGAPAAILVSQIMVPDRSDKRTGGASMRSRQRSHRAPWTRSSEAPRRASNYCSTSAPC